MYAFWKGLVEFRKSSYGEVFRIAEIPEEDHYTWIEPPNTMLLGYITGKRVMVLLNTDQKEGTFRDIRPPQGEWSLIATQKSLTYPASIAGNKFSELKGGMNYSITLPAQSLRIRIRKHKIQNTR